MQAGKTRLFGCFFNLKSTSGTTRYVQGLVDNHLYSILRVTEYKGKRFVILRNPWGYWEWTGPWSDGSAEWTDEWMELRRVLDHRFGDDGQFVMECTSFHQFTIYLAFLGWFLLPVLFSFRFRLLKNMGFHRGGYDIRFKLDNVLSVDEDAATTSPLPLDVWGYHLYVFHFSITQFVWLTLLTVNITLSSSSPVIIVLSRLDERSFSCLDKMSYWNLDFVVCKRGEMGYISTSDANARFYQRSVMCELELEAGEYVVYVSITRLTIGIFFLFLTRFLFCSREWIVIKSRLG